MLRSLAINVFLAILSSGMIFSGGSAQAKNMPETESTSSPSAGLALAHAHNEILKDAVMERKTIGVVLFDGFETLDVFGPVEMWGDLPNYQIVMVSQHGGLVRSAQGIETNAAYSFDTAPQFSILMVPGGMGARREVDNPALLEFIRRQDKGTEWTTAVCTGSAILAKAGILKGLHATSNKLAFDFAVNQDRSVLWQRDARWVVDGKYVTSSGVSAGTDMALGLVERIYNRHMAEKIAHETEYVWNDDPTMDLFAGVSK